MHTHER
jgi:hypothetical protein